jgi:uncharacterized protein YhaN
MRLTDLSVDGFGVWSNFRLSTLSQGLNVFYGPNEAGKTTLMHFVRSVFFSYSAERRLRYLPPVHGGQPGGSLQLMAGESNYLVARHTDDAGNSSQLIVSRGGRQAVDQEQALSALLGAVDEPTFNNVFVFGLQEIQELATLGDTKAADELYGLALGVDRVSLVDVLKELNTSRERLLAVDDRPSLVSQLLGQRERLQSEIEEQGQASVRYLSLSAERDRLDREINTLEAEHAKWEQHARRVALAQGLSDRWQRRGALGAQLQLLAHTDSLPDNGLQRFEEIEARLALNARRAKRLKRKRRQLREGVATLKINEALSRHAMRIEALAEQQPWMTALQKQIAELEHELLELETENDETKKQYGAGGTGGMSLSKRAIEELRSAAADLHKARRDAHRLHEQSSAAEEQAATIRRRVEESLGGVKHRNLTEALAEAGDLVSMLRKRVQLDERIGQMTARESELEERGHESLESQMLPTWILAGLGSLFVLGCALVLLFLAGMVLPGQLGDSLGWPVGLVGVGAAGAAGLMKFWMEWNAEGRVDKCHQQLGVLAQQVKQAKEERDELDERLPRGGGPLVARLQAAEKSLAKLEELLPLQSERDTAAAAADRSREQSEAVRDRCRDTRKRWLRLLAENGLPADLPPKQLKAFARGRRQAAGLGASIVDKKSELGRRRIEHDSLAARVTQLVSQVGIVTKSDRPLEQLQQCLTELAEQKSLVKQRAEITKQVAKIRPRYQQLMRRRTRLRRQRTALLRAAGTLDEVEFRRRAALQADALRLRGEHAQLEREILSALGDAGDETVSTWLTRGENLIELALHAAEASRAASARLSESNERRGELNVCLKQLAEDRQLTDKLVELEIVEQKLADALVRWRVLAVCSLLLVAVREFYEREHQPQVLREASGYLKRLTGGRYTRVWTPIGEHALRVDDREGQILTVDVLSSGTREQLFLALRLALASSFARRGIELPLVLDDVLVNFDVTRARAAALVLRDFAKDGHQVLLFTCHEHIAKLFRSIKADVRNLPERVRETAAEEPAPPKRRIREEPIPEPVVEEEPLIEFEPEPPTVEAEALLPEPQSIAEADPEPAPPVFEIAAPAPVAMKPLVIEIKPVVAAPVEVRQPPAPPRKRRRRVVQRLERQRWNAEEFDGELADRVRSDLWIEEELEPELAEAADDTAAA